MHPRWYVLATECVVHASLIHGADVGWCLNPLLIYGVQIGSASVAACAESAILGVSVHHLVDTLRGTSIKVFSDHAAQGKLTDRCGRAIRVADGTLWHLVQHYIRPLSQESSTSYVEVIRRHYANMRALDPARTDVVADHCGSAAFAVSVPMATPVTSVVDALAKWCDGEQLSRRRTYVWMCALCTNHAAPVTRHRSPARLFAECMGAVRTLLPVLSPLVSTPTYAQRRWCLYEYLVALQLKKSIVPVFTPDDVSTFMGMLGAEAAARPTIDRMLSTIESKHAALDDACTDKDAIDDYIAQHGGHAHLDAALRGTLSDALRQLR